MKAWLNSRRARASAAVALTVILAVAGFQNCSGNRKVTGDRPSTSTSGGNFQLQSTDGAALYGSRYADRFECGKKELSGTSESLVNELEKVVVSYGPAFVRDNQKGYLANSDIDAMDALLELYQTTNNVKYLQYFASNAQKVLAMRDDKTGHTDYRGRSGATWSNGDYTEGKPMSYLIEDGVIISSLAHFASIVNNAPCLKDIVGPDQKTFAQLAGDYVDAVAATFHFHNENRHTGVAKGFPISYYSAPPDVGFASRQILPGRPLPVNYIAAMGSALAYTYGATGDPSWHAYAEALGHFILLEMSYGYQTSTDAYFWPAWPQLPYWEGAGVAQYAHIEDTSHALLSAEFARALYEQGVGVFYPTELKRLSNTFRRHVYDRGAIRFYLDGSGPNHDVVEAQYARTAMLTPHDPGLWGVAYEIAVTKRRMAITSAGEFLGLARLARYYPR